MSCRPAGHRRAAGTALDRRPSVVGESRFRERHTGKMLMCVCVRARAFNCCDKIPPAMALKRELMIIGVLIVGAYKRAFVYRRIGRILSYRALYECVVCKILRAISARV